MRIAVTIFLTDETVAPVRLARELEQRGFAGLYLPEHTHIPVERATPYPAGGELPPEYGRTLDPFVALGQAAAVTERLGLGTGITLVAQHDPIALAKQIATLDHLSGGRVTIGAGFGWNTDELHDHGVPAGKRRTVLREYVEAMRALWTQDEAAYDGEFVSFGASWAWPKPAQSHVPLVIGAGAGPKTFAWIAAHADGWMTTPTENDVAAHAAQLHEAWQAAGRSGAPEIAVLVVSRPTPEDFMAWEAAGVTELIWGVPDKSADEVEAFIAKHGARLGLG